MKKTRMTGLLSIIWAFAVACSGGTSSTDTSTEATRAPKEIVIAFYNVENLFDTEDTPDKIDEEYLPSSKLNWTNEKYLKKLDNLTHAISGIPSKRLGPDILGVAEVENAQVMKDWVELTSLKERKYAIVHEESPDMRGIDVGLIYDPKIFSYVQHKAYEVDFPQEADYTSRKILWVEGNVNKEPLHVLVNHWPSRRGGQVESESRRLEASRVAKKIVDEIYAKTPDANIVLIGDFNDDPFNKSVAEVIGAKESEAEVAENGFYNPLAKLHNPDDTGTLTYRGKWNLFDQILISEDLIDNEKKLKYVSNSAAIHNPESIRVGGDGRSKDMPRRGVTEGSFRKEDSAIIFRFMRRFGRSRN